MKVTLREISAQNIDQVLALDVAEAQTGYVASNAKSIAQGTYEKNAWFRAIYQGEVPVGFAMLYIDPSDNEYFLWRLMVDARYQRSGIGRDAMQLVVDHVRSLGADVLKLSYVPGDASAEGFYLSIGFLQTGETTDDGTENVMAKALK